MIQIINGEITQYRLPKVGQLKDGRTVSGYHLLYEETLKDEGWLPLEDIQPEYDEEIQYLVQDGYEVLEDKVWVQPLGSHDSYKLGDKVIFESKVYVSIADNNIWKPGEYGWELE